MRDAVHGTPALPTERTGALCEVFLCRFFVGCLIMYTPFSTSTLSSFEWSFLFIVFFFHTDPFQNVFFVYKVCTWMTSELSDRLEDLHAMDVAISSSAKSKKCSSEIGEYTLGQFMERVSCCMWLWTQLWSIAQLLAVFTLYVLCKCFVLKNGLCEWNVDQKKINQSMQRGKM